MGCIGQFSRLLADEDGTTVIEYALIVFIFGIGFGSVTSAIGVSVDELLSHAGGLLQGATQNVGTKT